jgi:hypothetical protein
VAAELRSHLNYSSNRVTCRAAVPAREQTKKRPTELVLRPIQTGQSVAKPRLSPLSS